MRIATWNIKQAVAPKKPLDHLWTWASERIRPDCLVLTEAKVPTSGVPNGWTAHWNPEGVYPGKPGGQWGTVIAAKGVEIVPVTSVKTRLRHRAIEVEWPAAVQIVDVINNGEYWGTVVGFYAVTKDGRGHSTGNGEYSWPTMMGQLEPLLRSERGQRLVLAGDLNLWTRFLGRHASKYGLVDLVEHTAGVRPKIHGCANCESSSGCHHMWTHKNGNGPNSAVQQIDYIFASDALVKELKSVSGGIADFPDAWDVSDHAPVVAEFHV